MADRSNSGSAVPGLAVLGLFVVGICGLALAVFSVIRYQDLTGAGTCLIPSAIAFGVIAHISFR